MASDNITCLSAQDCLDSSKYIDGTRCVDTCSNGGYLFEN